jgi:hypothetical protein
LAFKHLLPRGRGYPKETVVKIKVPLCRHLKTNGIQCQSPALEYSDYCFFHDRLLERHRNFRTSKTTARGLHPDYDIQLHALEDAESIQLAISVVVNALASGGLRAERATAILYGLQLASSNVRNLAPKPRPEEVVRSIATTLDGLNVADTPTYTFLTPDQETSERLLREAEVTRRLGLPADPNVLPTE